MDKYVVVSTNNSEDYKFYAPYIERAWNKLGWNVCVMITPDVDASTLGLTNPSSVVHTLPNIEGVRMESIAQAGRLYAANYFPDNVLLMTSDMDLLPLSNYWTPDPHITTIYGHDLTDYSYYPMGYIAQSARAWKRFMVLSGDTAYDMKRDAEAYNHMARAKDWEAWWNWDWSMISDRMKPYASEFRFINRDRQPNGFAAGRIDRGNSMAHVDGELIDAHCENNNVKHPDKLNRFLQIFETTYGKL